MSPRTSIIMPVYNTADKVLASIQSVLAQTDPDFELLVLIDASPDDASTRIAQFLADTPDERVRVFDNPVNQGVSGVRNQGLDEARGEWIAFLDSDDSFEPNFLETMHRAVTGALADIAVCAHTLVEQDGTRTKRQRVSAGIASGEETTLELLRDAFTPYLWDKIFRASLFEGVRFPTDIHRAEDAVIVASTVVKATRVVAIDATLYNYTVDPNGLTWGRVTPVDESIRLMEYMRKATVPVLKDDAANRAFSVSWVLTFLNNAQQALMSQKPDSNDIIKRCRAQITWAQTVQTLRARPVFGAAATLLKTSPALYRVLYGAYVKRTYGL